METTDTRLQTKHLAFIACLITLLTVGLAISAVAITSTGLQKQQAIAETHDMLEDACAHSWSKELELVHHEAVTHSVDHLPIIATEQVNHTVCNTCDDIIDGQTTQHAALTGHKAYTTGVPFTETHTEKAAWTETVVDQDAYDELVATKETCALCGEERELMKDE